MSEENKRTGDQEPDTPEERPEAGSPSQERNDLVIEHWQAPKPDRMKGDGREIWEFESEKVGPSRVLWFNLFAIVLTLAGGLALIIYAVWRLASTIGP